MKLVTKQAHAEGDITTSRATPQYFQMLSEFQHDSQSDHFYICEQLFYTFEVSIEHNEEL